ncbi:MAG: hypothetical protein ACT6Q9_17855 [Polaromonas sp.]|uniref:hypothetical protein n=1 Tax=Polaromonas sp. TaxID=1869339 RepID=UPI0040352124
MDITPELVNQITLGAWIGSAIALPIAFFGWAFGHGLFKPPPDQLRRGSFQFYLVMGALTVLFGSALAGSGSCLVGLLQLQENVCPILDGRSRRGTFGYYLMPTWSAAMLSVSVWVLFRKPARARQQKKHPSS